MDDVVKEVGIVKGIVYFYFKSKEDFFWGVIEFWFVLFVECV